MPARVLIEAAVQPLLPGVDKKILARVLKSNEVYKTLSAVECGPFDGGCVIVAQALQRLVGGQICVLIGSSMRHDSPEQPHHAVVKKGSKFWDADGESTAEVLLARWQADEGINVTGIRKMLPGDLLEAPRNPQLSDRIYEYLRRKVTPKGPKPFTKLSPASARALRR